MSAFLLCLALNIYFEARGEPLPGQYAVAEVTIRRAENARTNICAEVFRPGQFSWTMEGKHFVTDPVAWDSARRVAERTINHRTNFSKGATHFHTLDIRPWWAATMCVTTTIGNHRFYKACRN